MTKYSQTFTTLRARQIDQPLHCVKGNMKAIYTWKWQSVVVIGSFTTGGIDHSHDENTLTVFNSKFERLRIYFIQRRHQWSKIIFVRKMLEKMIPDIRIKRHTYVRQISSRRAKPAHVWYFLIIDKQTYTDIEKLMWISPMLFLLLNLTKCSLSTFRRHLDSFLRTVPDHPSLPRYMQ